jgi:hypothetical protein
MTGRTTAGNACYNIELRQMLLNLLNQRGQCNQHRGHLHGYRWNRLMNRYRCVTSLM